MQSVTGHFAIGVRRACGLLRLNRALWYYRHHGRDDTAIRRRLRELAQVRPRFAYLRLHVMLRRIERRMLLKGEDCSLESHEKKDCPGFLASIIHDCSLRNAAATRDKREERDSHDVLALFLLVALFSPVSPESGIGDCSRSAHE